MTVKTKLFNKVSYKLQTHMPPNIIVSLIQVILYLLFYSLSNVFWDFHHGCFQYYFSFECSFTKKS